MWAVRESECVSFPEAAALGTLFVNGVEDCVEGSVGWIVGFEALWCWFGS